MKENVSKKMTAYLRNKLQMKSKNQIALKPKIIEQIITVSKKKPIHWQ